MTNSIRDIEDADCILLIGSNTTENHPLVARRIIRAKERGAKLIVADPREIQLTALADLWLRLRPGTDVALLNGLMHVIIAEGLEHASFIKERTEGFEELCQAVEPYTPAKTAELTGVSEEMIREAARLYAKGPASSIVYCMGITQHTTGVDNVLSCANLAMLTGNIGRPGTGVNPLRGQNNVQGACDMGALPNVLPGYQPVTDEAKRTAVQNKWGADIPGSVGLTVVEMINAAGEGKLKALYVMGENPLLSDPDINHVREALAKLELLVVQDIFPSETAGLAHVVLPGASWAEKDGTFTNTERRVQLIRKAVEPPGEARPDWEIICGLAAKMGLNGFSFSSAEEIFEEIRTVTPQYAGMTYRRLVPEGLQWPCPTEEHPGTPILHSKTFTRGKGKFHPVTFKPPAEEPDARYPFVLTTGRVGCHYHTGTMTRRSETLAQEMPTGFVEVNPQDAARLNIRDGEMARVGTRRGQITLRVRVTERVAPGILFVPFHFLEAAANILTNPALDPVAKIPEFKVCAAAIERLTA